MRDRRAVPLPLPLPRPECDASLAAGGIGGQGERWPREMRSFNEDLGFSGDLVGEAGAA